MQQPDISIIIVSWNVADLLDDCLRSIYATQGALSLEIWVVDNASSDYSVAMIEREYPQVQLIKNTQNVGFPGANNLALPECTGRYILFLNPDTIVCPHALDQLVGFMDREPTVGLVGPKIIGADGEVQYDCARNFPGVWAAFTEISYLRRLFPRTSWGGYQNMTYWDHLSNRDVPCLVGAAMLVRGSTAAQIGLHMDIALPMYLEDMEYCYRVGAHGWRVHYLSEAQIVHLGGQSSSRSPERIPLELLKWRSYEEFIRRYRTKFDVVLFRMVVFVFSALRIPLISAGILVGKIVGRESSSYFSSFTLHKAIALLVWSTGFRSNRWKSA